MVSDRLRLLAVPVIVATITTFVLIRAEQSAQAEPAEPSPGEPRPHRSNHATPLPTHTQIVARPSDGDAIVAILNHNPHSSQRVVISRANSCGESVHFAEPARPHQPRQPARLPTISRAPDKNRDEPPPASRRSFVVHQAGPFDDARFYARLQCRLVAYDHQCCIYVAPGVTDPSSLLLAKWLEVFGRQSDSVASILGTHASDIDGNGRFTILLITPPAGRGPLAYVRPVDFAKNQEELGNSADIMYLSSQLPPSSSIETLLAHEYAHAVCCSLRPGTREDDWLSEAIAHCVEQYSDVPETNFDHRLSRFLEHTERYPMAVRDYFAAGRFRDHGSRGATVSFLGQCVDRHGPRLLRDLARSGRTGIRSIAEHTNQTRQELLRNWAESLLGSTHQPRVVGRFLTLGPRSHKLPRGGSLELKLAPTSIAFVRVPANSACAFISVTSHGSSRPPIVEFGEAPSPLSMNASRQGPGTIRITIPPLEPGTKVLVSAEAHGPHRSIPLGIRETAGRQTEFNVPLRHRSSEIVVKAFTQDADGMTRTARRILPTVSDVKPRLTMIAQSSGRGDATGPRL